MSMVFLAALLLAFDDPSWIIEKAMFVLPLIASLSVHECAHAWTACRLGDDTARLMGRLTLNPLAHIDPIGTILLPLLGVPFGWAKPVPVNPLNFTRKINIRTGMMLTALAGPASNMAIALFCTFILGLLIRFRPDLLRHNEGLLRLLTFLMQLNVVLAMFNLLPVPPLDGSRIVQQADPLLAASAVGRFLPHGPDRLGGGHRAPTISGRQPAGRASRLGLVVAQRPVELAGRLTCRQPTGTAAVCSRAGVRKSRSLASRASPGGRGRPTPRRPWRKAD